MGNHYPVHRMTLNIHPKNDGGMLANFINCLGYFDAAGFAAATDFHLRLHYYNATDCFRGRNGLSYRGSNATFEHWNSVAFEEIPGLVFV